MRRVTELFFYLTTLATNAFCHVILISVVVYVTPCPVELGEVASSIKMSCHDIGILVQLRLVLKGSSH